MPTQTRRRALWCFLVLPVLLVPGAVLGRTGSKPAERAKPATPRMQDDPLAPPRVNPAMRCRTPTKETATAGGRYRQQVARLHVPEDCGTYGEFHDFGHYDATDYGGRKGLPAAYWVYHFPYWYLYRTEVKPATPPPPPPSTCRTPTQVDPAVKGKYQGLVAKLHVPEDCAAYGDFNDYGHYPATDYAGQPGLPAAHWVYHFPNWYLWQRQAPVAPPPARPAGAR